MDKFLVRGPSTLQGTIEAGGSKNCALPLACATLLAPGRHRLRKVPRLQDMDSTKKLLEHLGCRVSWEKSQDGVHQDWSVEVPEKLGVDAPYDLVRKMRASVLVLGPLVARMNAATVSLPGGCAIGARPIDLHLSALEKLGARIETSSGYVRASGRLSGNSIVFPMVSVGATENAVMAASLAEGTTVLDNVAREPEIRDLCLALVSMGAKIDGIGTSTLKVQGVASLRPMDFEVPPDRIEAATYLIAAQMTGGDVTLKGARPDDLKVVLEMLRKTGAQVHETADSIRVVGSARILPLDTATAPYPGFATDLQAQWVTLMTQADGDSVVTETIFENRFMHVPELCRMGAELSIVGSSVRVRGKRGNLQGAPVMATDLRASASLVMAALVAHGETSVKRIYHLDRGYESMELKLGQLGARVERTLDS